MSEDEKLARRVLLWANKVIGGFIASRSATILDSDHIRCFRRPYPEFGAPPTKYS
jgi:hypothetical protein